jgi:DNA-binding MarR family transcriptional regulator
VNRTKNSTGGVRTLSTAGSFERVPSVVGRVRLAYDLGKTEMLAGIHAAGYLDVTTAMIALFRFAGVDGRRPSEIAATARLSKQATNDLLRELERLGYVERHPDPTDGRARIVRLTARGQGLDTAVWTAGREVEQSWRDRFGDTQWTTFNAVLDALITATE